MEVDRELLKGSISLLSLNLLSRGERYGYEILQAAVVRRVPTRSNSTKARSTRRFTSSKREQVR